MLVRILQRPNCDSPLRRGMPMDTEGKNTGALVKADIVLSERDMLRVGGEYQRYRLNDWWDPSGMAACGPNTFWNINNGERDRLDCLRRMGSALESAMAQPVRGAQRNGRNEYGHGAGL